VAGGDYMPFKFEIKNLNFSSNSSNPDHKVKKTKVTELQKSINEIIENLKIIESILRPE
jgi:hypothetical protein